MSCEDVQHETRPVQIMHCGASWLAFFITSEAHEIPMRNSLVASRPAALRESSRAIGVRLYCSGVRSVKVTSIFTSINCSGGLSEVSRYLNHYVTLVQQV